MYRGGISHHQERVIAPQPAWASGLRRSHSAVRSQTRRARRRRGACALQAGAEARRRFHSYAGGSRAQARMARRSPAQRTQPSARYIAGAHLGRGSGPRRSSGCMHDTSLRLANAKACVLSAPMPGGRWRSGRTRLGRRRLATACTAQPTTARRWRGACCRLAHARSWRSFHRPRDILEPFTLPDGTRAVGSTAHDSCCSSCHHTDRRLDLSHARLARACRRCSQHNHHALHGAAAARVRLLPVAG
jgi:hypothetical protein